MGKFDGYMIFSDLDSTLTVHYHDNIVHIPQRNIDAIEYFKSEGGKFAFSTGRLPGYLKREVFHLLKPNAPCIVLGGACIYDFESESYLRENFLPKESFDYIFRILNENCTLVEDIFFNSEDGMKEVTFNGKKVSREYFDSVALAGDKWCKTVIHGYTEEGTLKVKESFNKDKEFRKICDLVRSWNVGLETLDIKSTKGKCVEILKDMLGIKTTIAVGDYENDISMLVSADMGYAVENALPNVKEVADFITVDNTKGALAEIIYNL